MEFLSEGLSSGRGWPDIIDERRWRMALTLKGLTKDLLTDLVRLGLEDYALSAASLPASPVGGPDWKPLAMIADDGITGFIAYVDDGDGDGHYGIMLTVEAGRTERG